MAWNGTLITSLAIALTKAGANVSTAISGDDGTITNPWINHIEEQICLWAKADVVTGYSGLSQAAKRWLVGLAQAMFCTIAIMYDASGYTNQQEALTMLNVLDSEIQRGKQMLDDPDSKALLGLTTSSSALT